MCAAYIGNISKIEWEDCVYKAGPYQARRLTSLWFLSVMSCFSVWPIVHFYCCWICLGVLYRHHSFIQHEYHSCLVVVQLWFFSECIGSWWGFFCTNIKFWWEWLACCFWAILLTAVNKVHYTKQVVNEIIWLDETAAAVLSVSPSLSL